MVGALDIGIRSLSALLVKLAQFLAAPIATAASLFLLTTLYGIKINEDYVSLAITAVILTMLFVRKAHPGNNRVRLFSGYVGTIITGWIVVVGAILLIGYATKTSAVYSRLTLFTWFLLNPVAIVFLQWALQELLVHVMNLTNSRKKVVIGGINDVSLQLAKNIKGDDQLGLQLLGFFEDRNPERLGDIEKGEILGSLADMPAYVKANRVETIYIALPIRHLERTRVLMDQLQDTTASIYFVPDIFVFDLIQSRIDDIHGVPVFALCETPFYGYNGILKRLFDLAASAAILTMISPLLLLIAAGVKFSSPGPVLFKQRRYGLAGEEIKVYKFRTMTVTEDGDNVRQAEANDERFTRIGAFLRKHSLDELPQFFNVIKGDMSIVGPRPHAVAHNELYRKLIVGYMMRHKVPPGITGWAQVNGCRGETKEVAQMESRVRFDLEYLRKWSLAMDIKIILRTLGLIVNDKEAH